MNVQGLLHFDRPFHAGHSPTSLGVDLMNCEYDRTKESEVKLSTTGLCMDGIACAGNRTVSRNFILETEGPRRSLRENFHRVGHWHSSIFRWAVM